MSCSRLATFVPLYMRQGIVNPLLKSIDGGSIVFLQCFGVTGRIIFVKIRNWDFNWKMLFNLDPTKQAKEGFFSKKKKKNIGTCPSLFFNNLLIEQDTTQKHLGLILDHKLTF